MQIFDGTLRTLEAGLDTRLLRENVLASNAANVDTPNFQPKDVDFGTAMAQAQAAIEARDGADSTLDTALAGARPALVNAPDTTPGLDGNKVDMDRTMGEIAENALQYGAVARAAAKKLAILRYVASDGAA